MPYEEEEVLFSVTKLALSSLLDRCNP